ncbi:MAG: hypothetical protein HY777_10660 [Betaproteobacteria bacterium]|nr:hypothetical protein [Betaproteobacteria bacterium]
MNGHTFFTPTEREVVATVAAAPRPPGTVLDNVDRLLQIIGATGVAVSPKTSEFAIAGLPKMNASLVEPTNIGLARGRQQSYPQLDGLHLLLRTSGLCRVYRDHLPARMVADPVMLGRWEALTPTERYFSLLDTWWNDPGDDEIWGAIRAAEKVGYRVKLLKLAGQKGKCPADDPRHFDACFRLLGMREIALMQMFGMLDVGQENTVVGQGWEIRRLAATRLSRRYCSAPRSNPVATKKRKTRMKSLHHFSAGSRPCFRSSPSGGSFWKNPGKHRPCRASLRSRFLCARISGDGSPSPPSALLPAWRQANRQRPPSR